MENNKINLLIVDDEEQFLNSISKSLELRDFKVIAVNRGEKAIEAARNNSIDIALVDLKMPGINGEETLKKLKAEFGKGLKQCLINMGAESPAQAEEVLRIAEG